MLCKKGVLKSFAIFVTPVLESLFNKVFKKRLQHRYFSVNIVKFLRTPFLKNIWERLLLEINFFYIRTNFIGRMRLKLVNELKVH